MDKLWLCVNILLASAGWRAARRADANGDFAAYAVHCIVVCWGSIVVAAFVLGAVRALTVGAVLTAVAGLSGTLLWACRPRATPGYSRSVELSGTRMLWACPLAWSVALTFATVHSIMRGLLMLPDDWDTLMYHLPLVDQWLAAGSLYAPDASHWSNPGNNEILAMWLVAPFSGDFLAALNNLPAVALLGFATVGLGAEVGLSRAFRHLCGMAVLGNSIVLHQLTNADNDVASAALLVASADYGVRFARRGRAADLILYAIALGLLAGIKYYSLGYAGVVWMTIALLASVRGRRAGLVAAGAGLAGLTLFGGYWYFRNWLVTGQPLYPLGSAGVGDIHRPLYPTMWQSTLLGNGRAELVPLASAALARWTGPCSLAAVAGLPLGLAWLLASGRSRLRAAGVESEGPARLALGVLTVSAGVVFAVTPFCVEDIPGTLNQLEWGATPARYGLGFLSLALLGPVVMMGDLARLVASRLSGGSKAGPLAASARWLAVNAMAIVLTAALAFQFVSALRGNDPQVKYSPILGAFVDDRDVLLWANIVLDVLLAAIVLRHAPIWAIVASRWNRAAGRLVLVLLGSAVVAGALASVHWVARGWHREFASYYDNLYQTGAFERLARLDPGSTYLCVLEYRGYPFFGSSRRFRVYNPFSVDSYESLLADLRRRRITHIAARTDPGPSWSRYHDADRWLSEHPAIFRAIERGGWLTLYEVDLDAIDRAPAR